MVDQPHTEQPPERKAPSKWSSNITKAVAGIAFAAGTLFTVVGVIAIARPKTQFRGSSFSRGEGALMAAGGLSIGMMGKALWDHANFAGVVREANRRDDLLLERASIDKELAQQHSR